VTEATRYELIIAPTARRQLSEVLPEAVAFAALEFITGALLDNPHRVGKQLHPPLDDRHSARRGTYRIIYRIDDDPRVVTVMTVAARRDVYRKT
jgi:mRNA-degrading endonuclease RelE of RelBE toxin-antitoxin system